MSNYFQKRSQFVPTKETVFVSLLTCDTRSDYINHDIQSKLGLFVESESSFCSFYWLPSHLGTYGSEQIERWSKIFRKVYSIEGKIEWGKVSAQNKQYLSHQDFCCWCRLFFSCLINILVSKISIKNLKIIYLENNCIVT